MGRLIIKESGKQDLGTLFPGLRAMRIIGLKKPSKPTNEAEKPEQKDPRDKSSEKGEAQDETQT